jgi:hypothetical protein
VETEGVIQIPLLSRRRERGRFLQKFQHVIPAIPLLGAGIQGLMHGERGFALALAVAEIVTSALLLRSMVKEFAAFRKSSREPHADEHAAHHAVDWFEIFAAGMLLVEALERWHLHPHLPRPMLLTALVTLALGLFHGRIAAFTSNRRSLRIDAEGIRIGGRFIFSRFFVGWPNIERIDLDDSKARILARNGRRRHIDLKDLRNGAEVREALLAARARLTS